MIAGPFFEDVGVGDSIPDLVKEPVTEVQLVRYAGASGDFNPIHTVHRVAEQAGLGGVIAHGMLIMAFVAQAITRWVPDRSLRKFKVRFSGITRPGDVITVSGRVTGKHSEPGKGIVICQVEAKNQRGETKVTGEFEAELPTKTAVG